MGLCNTDGKRMKLLLLFSRSESEGCHGNTPGYKPIVSFRVQFWLTFLKEDIKCLH